MLGPLNLERREASTPPLEPIRTGEPGRPGQQAPSTIFLQHDPVAEAMQQETRTRELWRKHCPEIFAAREAVDAAEWKYKQAVDAFQARSRQVSNAENRLASANPQVIGERDDAVSSLAIAKGYALVSKHALDVAWEESETAREKLKAVTGAKR